MLDTLWLMRLLTAILKKIESRLWFDVKIFWGLLLKEHPYTIFFGLDLLFVSKNTIWKNVSAGSVDLKYNLKKIYIKIYDS